MKNIFISTLITILIHCTSVNAQQFISINPDFGLKGQNISTIVTGSNFFFTWGSTPTTWGDFYMSQNGTQILPSSITVIDDDHLNVVWPIPSNALIGNYSVIWDMFIPWGSYSNSIPGGFNVECVPPPAQIINSAPAIICPGSTLVLQANTGAGYSYQWYNSVGPLVGATNSSYTVSTSGYYRVRVSDASGCPRFSSETIVTVTSLPTATISPSTSQIICPGSSVVLTANNNTSYQWFKNGNLLSGITTKSITVSDAGSYTVRVTNYYGCTKVSNPVTVNLSTQPPSYVTAIGPLTFCAGNSVTLKTAAGYNYQWYKYGNPIAGATNQSLVVTTSGSYKVVVTNASGCTKKSGAKVVNVLNSPSAIITPVGSTSICVGDSVKLNATTGSGYTYLWKRYGVPISGPSSSSYFAFNGGNYKVVVTHPNGCSKTSSATNVSVVCRLASLTQETAFETNIAPNPANDFITVSGENITKVEIRNMEGKIVKTTIENTNLTIDISRLPNGLYIAVIYSNNDVTSKRFIKQSSGNGIEH